MSHRYSTALSHLVLAGTSIYCLHAYYGGELKLPCASYTIIITNSLLGTWRWGNPDYGDSVENIYNFTTFLQGITSLPFVVAQVWLNQGYPFELAICHAGASLIPFSLYLADKSKEDITDAIIAIGGISLGVTSLLQGNYFGVAASVSYLFNHFVLREGQLDIDLPIIDLYNYGLCFFCYFALRAL
ncbi:hypothetical protein RN001_007127 [Aquatica leii]|uniref:Transmembrane protein n=1 Tax=Aquatica leii TaxID=1421715 RepID=A0AAN7PB88_9COLE|nr:hypothetical protein RN001_007127 [Aquatica leii]